MGGGQVAGLVGMLLFMGLVLLVAFAPTGSGEGNRPVGQELAHSAVRPPIMSAEEVRRQRCPHTAAVPVEAAITSELVAHWCPDCETQLGADWKVSFVDLYADPNLLSGPREPRRRGRTR